MYKYDLNFNTIQNLQDAGCDEETIASFLSHQNNGQINEGLKLLQAYRKSILDNLHNNQKQIDYLDYFIYQIKKANANLK